MALLLIHRMEVHLNKGSAWSIIGTFNNQLIMFQLAGYFLVVMVVITNQTNSWSIGSLQELFISAGGTGGVVISLKLELSFLINYTLYISKWANINNGGNGGSIHSPGGINKRKSGGHGCVFTILAILVINDFYLQVVGVEMIIGTNEVATVWFKNHRFRS